MKRLSREEFCSAMHKGLGRAYLHVRQYGIEGIEDIIENAILHNLVFDVQSEGGRADWLFSILKESNQLQYYEDFLIKNFDKIENDWDYDQAFDLLYHFWKNGNKTARKKLYQEFDKQKFNESWIGGEQIIDLDGVNGFIHVAEIIGKRLREDKDYWEDDYLLNETKERFGRDTVEEALEQKRRVSTNLEYYLQNIKAHTKGTPETKEQRIERIRKQLPIEQIKDDIEKAKGEFPGRYTSFGRHASKEDIQNIFGQLLRENRFPQLIRLFWIFRRRELPKISNKIIAYAKSDNNELACAAISALSNSKDMRLHHLAIELMINKEWIRAAYGFELLIRNYEDGDTKAIKKLLELQPDGLDPYEIHNVIYDLIEMAEKNNPAEFKTILLWIYENSPCMNCRGRAVKLMIKHNSIPETILNECLFDGDEGIREMAKQENPSKTSLA